MSKDSIIEEIKESLVTTSDLSFLQGLEEQVPI